MNLGAHPFFGNVPHWAYRGTAPRPDLMFTATPMRDTDGRVTGYLLGWEDGSTGRLSVDQWSRWVVNAGGALAHGRADRASCRELDRGQLVDVVAFLVTRARARLTDELMRWWALGYHGEQPS